MADPRPWHGKRMQLHGFVVDKSICASRTRSSTAFRSRATARSCQAQLHRRRARHVQGWPEVVLKGQLGPHGFDVDAERRDGQVPVEVRSQQGSDARQLASCDVTRGRATPCLHSDSSSSSPPSSPARTRSRPRWPARGAGRPARRKRHRRVLLRRRADDGRVGVLVHAFVTDNYAIKYVAALFGFRAAAGLQDRVVLGRARRLDHVLGLPAGDVRLDRGLLEPRAPPRADPLRRRRSSPPRRCSSSS